MSAEDFDGDEQWPDERIRYFTLADDDRTPVRCGRIAWGRLLEGTRRGLAISPIAGGRLGEVVTFFLGFDHTGDWRRAHELEAGRPEPQDRPCLWETHVFGGPFGDGQIAYREPSWCRAAARHRMVVRELERRERQGW